MIPLVSVSEHDQGYYLGRHATKERRLSTETVIIEPHPTMQMADFDEDENLTGPNNSSAIGATSQELTERVIAYEGSEAPTDTFVGFRACEKLRRPLSTLLGTLGYRALVLRALTLARRESSQLESVRVKEDGSLDKIDPASAVAGTVLAEQLIGLLLSFVGEAITLRLLHDVWSDLGDLNTTQGETE